MIRVSYGCILIPSFMASFTILIKKAQQRNINCFSNASHSLLRDASNNQIAKANKLSTSILLKQELPQTKALLELLSAETAGGILFLIILICQDLKGF